VPCPVDAGSARLGRIGVLKAPPHAHVPGPSKASGTPDDDGLPKLCEPFYGFLDYRNLRRMVAKANGGRTFALRTGNPYSSRVSNTERACSRIASSSLARPWNAPHDIASRSRRN
jgi:hypothetical protein